MNRTVCGTCWALYDDEGLCECLPKPKQEHEMITVGPFFLKHYDEHSFWLGHESGEGMQVRDHRVLDMLNELWKEF